MPLTQIYIYYVFIIKRCPEYILLYVIIYSTFSVCKAFVMSHSVLPWRTGVSLIITISYTHLMMSPDLLFDKIKECMFVCARACVFVCDSQPAPTLSSQCFLASNLHRGNCSISTGFMHFEICILLCHFCLFWRFSNKTGEMSPRVYVHSFKTAFSHLAAGFCQSMCKTSAAKTIKIYEEVLGALKKSCCCLCEPPFE